MPIGLLLTGLVACSTGTPSPERLTQHVQSIPSSTALAVVSEDSYPNVVDQQAIMQGGSFKTVDSVYDEASGKELIPSGATLRGIYSNDGVTCNITWDAVYANNDENENAMNAVNISQITTPTLCNPGKGIKKGDRLLINFTNRTK